MRRDMAKRASVLALAVAGLLGWAGGATAQEAPRGPEVGVRGGISHFPGEDGSSSSTVIAFPAEAFPFNTAAYFTFFTGSSTAIEPHVGFVSYLADGQASTRLSLALQLMEFREEDPVGTPSLYGFFHGGLVGASGSGRSETYFHLGGGGGYRTIVRETLGVRVELRLRRWLEDIGGSQNEISVGVGLGAILR